MAEVQRCVRCHVNLTEDRVEGSALCSTCLSADYRRAQPSASAGPNNPQVCQSCQITEAHYVCLCGYPLKTFCENCGLAHRNKDITGSHQLQPVALMPFITSNEDLQHHKHRLIRIDQAKAGLKAFPLAKLEDAKRDLDAGIGYLKSVLENLHRDWIEQLVSIQRSLDNEMRVLEQLKTDLTSLPANSLELWISDGDSVLNGASSEELWSCFYCNFALESAETGLKELCSIDYRDIMTSAQLHNYGPSRSQHLAVAPIHNGQVADGLQAYPTTFHQGYDPNSYEPAAVQPLQPVYHQPSNGYGGSSELDQSSAAYRTSAQFYGNPQSQVPCVVCNTAFIVTHSWQSLQEGGQVCSYPCRTYYEQNTGTRCATCQATVTDQSWWAAAAQQYGAYQDHFRTFCSFQCFKNHFPPAKTEPKSLECAACAVPIHPNKLSEIKAIQLTCLHSFHDVNCAYRYMSEINGNFTRRVIVVCPICQTPITEDLLRYVRDEQSRMKQNGRKQEHAGKQQSNPRSSGKFDAPVKIICYKCNKEPASQVFDCGHNICNECKISVFLGAWFKCPICSRS